MKIDPRQFRTPYIDLATIRREADAFRAKYWNDTPPVDILDILEFGLEMEIVPVQSLRSDFDIDALLMADFQTMRVDQEEYMDGRYENRLRFSVAHEIGHLVLHRDVWTGIPIDTPENWVAFIRDLPEDQWRWLENHANEFAGRLLVPVEPLREHFASVAARVPTEIRDWDPTGDQTIQYLSNKLCSDFDVSREVIEHRIRREELKM